MRIGFDATVLAPATRYTGGGEYALRLLRHLGRVDGDSSYVAYGAPGTAPPPGLPPNTEWRSLPRLHLGKLSAFATHMLVLPRLARRDRLDLVHAPTVHTRPSMPPIPHRLPCRLIVTVHDVIPINHYQASGQSLPWRMRAFYKWNLRAAQNANHVITVSETSRSDILSLWNIPASKITAIYNGVEASSGDSNQDRSVLERHGIRQPYMLFVGSWEPRKNLARLLEAFDLAVARGLPHDLVMVVDRRSGHAAGVRAKAAALSSRPRLRFLHSLDDGEMGSLYHYAHLLAFPSLYEGFGLPAAQALAYGTAVVASRAGALPEVLGDAAYYVDPHDVQSIADGLYSVASDADLNGSLTEAGLRRVSRFSWEEAAHRTVNVYRLALGRPVRASVHA